MLRILISSFERSSVRYAPNPSSCLYGKASSDLHASKKVNQIAQNMKWNESLADKARSLIFGEKKYTEFTSEERKIVDFYQTKKLEEDAVILPNTREAIEQEEIEQILLKRDKS